MPIFQAPMELTKSVAPRKEDQDEREPAAGHPSKPPLVPWWKDTETTESLPGNSYRRTDAQAQGCAHAARSSVTLDWSRCCHEAGLTQPLKYCETREPTELGRTVTAPILVAEQVKW